ncbi:uncharacterized protein [Ptychodera flava]|uniref:uncharacterized protein isoform X2 n=1 Tax=Ptychodera flava TaxID=63121 RepID=UPI003969C5D9
MPGGGSRFEDCVIMMKTLILLAMLLQVVAKERQSRDRPLNSGRRGGTQDSQRSLEGNGQDSPPVIGCKSQGDSPVAVDWWVIYKKADYSAFEYYDSDVNNDNGNMKPLGRPIEDYSPLSTTFSDLTSEINGGHSISYFGYSNELNRVIDNFPIRGHSPVSNGFMAYDPESANGFWLMHSDPFFPPSPDGRKLDDPSEWGWINSAGDHPLTYFCMTIRSKSAFDKISQFLSQLNPFTFLEHTDQETPAGLSEFLQRSNSTNAQIYLKAVFENYKQCLLSLPGNTTYEKCLTADEVSVGDASSTFTLLAKNKAMVGDICLNVDGTSSPHLQKSLLPPLRNFLHIFAVVGELADDKSIVCIGDLENSMARQSDGDSFGLRYQSSYIKERSRVFSEPSVNPSEALSEGSVDYMLQKLLSSRNTSELDMYGGVSGGMVCFRSSPLWESLIARDLYMEANCFDSAAEEIQHKVHERIKRGGKRRSQRLGVEYGKKGDDGDEGGERIQKKGKTASLFAMGEQSISFQADQFQQLGDSLPEWSEEEDEEENDDEEFDDDDYDMIEEEDNPEDQDLTCYALHCDGFRDNYAWLLWQPPIESEDIEVTVFTFPERQELKQSHIMNKMFSFTIRGESVLESFEQQMYDIRVFTSETPFENLYNLDDEMDEEELDSKNGYVAILIGRLQGHRDIRGEIQYRFNMRIAGTSFDEIDAQEFIVTTVMTRKQRREWEESILQERYAEITMCVDYCPLAECKYNIYKKTESSDGFEYLPEVCNVPGIGISERINSLNEAASANGCTREDFQNFRCLVFEDISECKEIFDEDDVALEPIFQIFDFDDIDEEEKDYMRFGFCQSNIINHLFFGEYKAPRETYPSSNADMSDNDIEYRRRRAVYKDSTNPSDCTRFFTGGAWPPSTINSGNRVKICQTCKLGSSKNGYCFATLYNTDLRMAEYSAYIAITPTDGTKRNPRKAVGDDKKLWGRYEIGLCESSKKLLYETNNACNSLGPVNLLRGKEDVKALGDTIKKCNVKLKSDDCIKRQTADKEYDEANVPVKRKWDRGHLNPAYINSHDVDEMRATFVLNNAAPQLGVFNRKAWREMECLIAHYVWYMRKPNDGPVYILTGVKPYSTAQKVGTTKLENPQYFWTAMCDPTKKKFLAFTGVNDATGQIDIKTIPELQKWLYGSGSSKELFSGQTNNCITKATQVDTKKIPKTSSCRIKEVKHLIDPTAAKTKGKTTTVTKKGAKPPKAAGKKKASQKKLGAKKTIVKKAISKKAQKAFKKGAKQALQKGAVGKKKKK